MTLLYKNLRVFAFSLIALVGTHSASASAAPFSLGVEPIIGYERVQKFQPTPHSKNRLIYGARLTLGFPLLAAEAQVTRGDDTESYLDRNLTIHDVDDKAKLGLRSSLRLSTFVTATTRAGVQASRNTHTETLNSEAIKTVEKIRYNPYAGAQLGLRLLRSFELTGGITAIFKEFPKMEKNEYETTLGFRIKFP
ncbi:MAG: hypothetical protein A2Z97_01150 [Bdellovibrionales bacterium GWB1_52_6]|nr:MAG: hypothetical protein A2Z97_01150 [Bdellovibrionales bacterium GWB1_52_6]OFZ05429.1 MAG: hypothetical protein A2X97_11150 [Bdellovibrionales bacterium GWA1_52_35]HCM39209.1 hypothetical protein [Bdellovibrionales bacterium]